tara:strand:- start:1265 stop:1462 length:198 start_codon:yes stop_codon:yes gene_type:complete
MESIALLILSLLAIIIIICGYIFTQIQNLKVYDKANENQLKNLAADIRANNRVIAKHVPDIVYND